MHLGVIEQYVDIAIIVELIAAGLRLVADRGAAFSVGEELNTETVFPHILGCDGAQTDLAVDRVVHIAAAVSEDADQQEHKRRNTNGDEQNRQEGHLSLLRLAAAGNIVRRARRLRAAGGGRGGVIGIGIAWYFRRV